MTELRAWNILGDWLLLIRLHWGALPALILRHTQVHLIISEPCSLSFLSPGREVTVRVVSVSISREDGAKNAREEVRYGSICIFLTMPSYPVTPAVGGDTIERPWR
tara:strand:+ start:259 stop:576 length:318 start_codon:yes stop_codon:yes gene_type:complete